MILYCHKKKIFLEDNNNQIVNEYPENWFNKSFAPLSELGKKKIIYSTLISKGLHKNKKTVNKQNIKMKLTIFF